MAKSKAGKSEKNMNKPQREYEFLTKKQKKGRITFKGFITIELLA